MRIVLYIIWALIVTGAVTALVQTLRKTKRHEKVIAGWPKVQATVTGNVGGWSRRHGRLIAEQALLPHVPVR